MVGKYKTRNFLKDKLFFKNPFFFLIKINYFDQNNGRTERFLNIIIMVCVYLVGTSYSCTSGSPVQKKQKRGGVCLLCFSCSCLVMKY